MGLSPVQDVPLYLTRLYMKHTEKTWETNFDFNAIAVKIIICKTTVFRETAAAHPL